MEENTQPNYFSKELEERIRTMTDSEMFQLMKEFEARPEWIAMLRYNQVRMGYIQSSILSADPVTNPTAIARNQGVMLGLSDFQNAVIMLVQERQAAEDGKEVEADGTEVE